MAVYLSTELNQEARDLEAKAVLIREEAADKVQAAEQKVSDAQRELDDATSESNDAERAAAALEVEAGQLYGQARSATSLENDGTLGTDDVIDVRSTRGGLFG